MSPNRCAGSRPADKMAAVMAPNGQEALGGYWAGIGGIGGSQGSIAGALRGALRAALWAALRVALRVALLVALQGGRGAVGYIMIFRSLPWG